MPGSKNGSSIYDAFEWDHSQHPDGIRVYGRLGSSWPFNMEDWWEVRLLEGVAYSIQVRLPTGFDPELYLCTDYGLQVAYDDDSGDDGPPLSKMVYTPASTEPFYVLVRDKLGEYGVYTLECVPAPQLGWGAWARVGGRFNAHEPPPPTAGVASRFAAVTEVGPPTAGVASRFDVKVEAVVAGVGSRFEAHQQVGAGVGSRMTTWELRVAGVASRLAALQVMVAEVVARLAARAQVVGMAGSARHHALVQKGWGLWARDVATGIEVNLGWIPAEVSPRRLVDVPLADGIYEIEARPAADFWAECRGRKVTTVVIDGGHCQAGLPTIQGLASTVAEGVTFITWRVAEGELGGTFTFELWFGPTSPVATSGPPDLVLPYSPGQGDYLVTRLQTVPEFVAVAAVAGTEVGPVFELLLTWGAMGPVSPANQVAMVGIEE